MGKTNSGPLRVIKEIKKKQLLVGGHQNHAYIGLNRRDIAARLRSSIRADNQLAGPVFDNAE